MPPCPARPLPRPGPGPTHPPARRALSRACHSELRVEGLTFEVQVEGMALVGEVQVLRGKNGIQVLKKMDFRFENLGFRF